MPLRALRVYAVATLNARLPYNLLLCSKASPVPSELGRKTYYTTLLQSLLAVLIDREHASLLSKLRDAWENPWSGERHVEIILLRPCTADAEGKGCGVACGHEEPTAPRPRCHRAGFSTRFEGVAVVEAPSHSDDGRWTYLDVPVTDAQLYRIFIVQTFLVGAGYVQEAGEHRMITSREIPFIDRPETVSLSAWPCMATNPACRTRGAAELLQWEEEFECADQMARAYGLWQACHICHTSYEADQFITNLVFSTLTHNLTTQLSALRVEDVCGAAELVQRRYTSCVQKEVRRARQHRETPDEQLFMQSVPALKHLGCTCSSSLAIVLLAGGVVQKPSFSPWRCLPSALLRSLRDEGVARQAPGAREAIALPGDAARVFDASRRKPQGAWSSYTDKEGAEWSGIA